MPSKKQQPLPNNISGWEPNEETEVPKASLESVGIVRLEDLGRVVLAHRNFSVPAATARGVLNYYNVDQDRVVMDMPSKTSLKSCPDYKKVPIVFVIPSNLPEAPASNGAEGYQLNDSFMIVQALYPVLTEGRSWVEDAGPNSRISDVAASIMVATLAGLAGQKGGVNRFSRHWASHERRRPLIKLITRVVLGKLLRNHTSSSNEDAPSLSSAMRSFMGEITARNHGGNFWTPGSEPGPVDLYVYSILSAAIAVSEDTPRRKKGSDLKASYAWIMDDLRVAGASDWFLTVSNSYHDRASEAVITEEMKKSVPKTLWGFW